MEHKKYEVGHSIYTENELWNFIVTLSRIKSRYDFLNEEEQPKYRACKVAIDAIKAIMGIDKL